MAHRTGKHGSARANADRLARSELCHGRDGRLWLQMQKARGADGRLRLGPQVSSLGGWLPRGVYLPCSMGYHPLLGAVLALPRAGGPAEALTGIAFDSYVPEW